MVNTEVIKSCIRDRKFSKKAEDELIDILERREDELVELKKDFNSSTNKDYLRKNRRRFPKFKDHATDIKDFEDHKNLEMCILVSWLLEENMEQFYEETEERMERLRNYLDEGNEGEDIYRFLVDGRGISDEEAEQKLMDIIEGLDQEFENYDDEEEAYSDRDINESGLLVSDAVKCLEDFEGRTFPFLRAICKDVEKGMDVFEIGVGTGILSFASLLRGADRVVGVEINPATCILSKVISEYLEENNVIEEDSFVVEWGDALKFGIVEYEHHGEETFDAVISENIYTGMFYELQMSMLSRVIRNGLVETEKKLAYGFYHDHAKCPVIPSGMSSSIELVQLTEEKDFEKPTEVLIDLQDRGIDVEKRISEDKVYDQIDFSMDEVSNIKTLVKFKAVEDGRVDGINLYSTLRLTEGDYIGRNENEFLNNDSILFLNESLEVEKGDLIIVGMAYNESDEVRDIVLELRKLNEDKSVDEKYNARLNISEKKHKMNKLNYKERNNLKQHLNLKDMGDFEVVKSSTFYDGYDHRFMSDIDYKNIEEYGV